MNIKMIFKWLVVSTTLILVSFCAVAVPSRAKTGAHVTGHVSCNGRMLPFVTITVRGTTIGTATDRQGYYRLPDLPLGEQTIVANSIGYRIATKQVTTKPNESVVLDFELEEDLLNVDAVVVTGDKDAISRREASTIVNSVTPKLMVQNNARSISEGLPYIPGVRMENNCQNCGFNQVRLNGMEGEYTQTLVDGHPIFSGLMGVYGLEFIPANMIERIEVQRGGGSALYGSNAVAGTVNPILQDPMVNTFQAGFNTDFIGVGIQGSGGVKPDYSASFNSSNVTDNNKAGIAVYGNVRYRTPFDLIALVIGVSFHFPTSILRKSGVGAIGSTVPTMRPMWQKLPTTMLMFPRWSTPKCCARAIFSPSMPLSSMWIVNPTTAVRLTVRMRTPLKITG